MTAIHYIIGIDPGLTGGLAIISAATGELLHAVPMPTKHGKVDAQGIAHEIRQTSQAVAFVEAVSSRPRQAGQFQFGVNTGICHGVLGALSIPMHLVAPQSWKAAFGIKRGDEKTKAQTKTEARELAAKLFPSHAKSFKRVKDDGVAESSLIALYGLNLHLSTKP